jgi:hypothetical protein
VGLIATLSVLAASPDLHAWLHTAASAHEGDRHGCAHACSRDLPPAQSPADAPAEPEPAAPDDTGCVIDLFARGIPALLDARALPAVERFIAAVLLAWPETVRSASTRHLWPLTQAPPRA